MILALGRLHGLGVSNRIEQITKGTFQVKSGSLFPALSGLAEAGFKPSLTNIALSKMIFRHPFERLVGVAPRCQPLLNFYSKWRNHSEVAPTHHSIFS